MARQEEGVYTIIRVFAGKNFHLLRVRDWFKLAALVPVERSMGFKQERPFSEFLLQAVCLGIKIAAEEPMIEHEIPVKRHDCGISCCIRFTISDNQRVFAAGS